MKKLLNKLFVLLLIVQLTFVTAVPVSYAQTETPTPSVQQEVSAPAPTESTQPVSTESTPDAVAPTPTSAPTDIQNPSPSNSPSENTTQTQNASPSMPNPVTDRDAYKAASRENAIAAYESFHGGNVGDSAITTGDAQNNSAVINSANSNLASSPTIGDVGSSAVVANSGNGVSSDNNSSAKIANDKNTNQDNSASVLSGLHQDSVTGHSGASFNVGNSSLNTGDANTTGTVITSANTNVDGVMVSEFNIVDDHNGDIILDFGANCISGCTASNAVGGNPFATSNVANNGNGAFSDNNANADITNNTNSFQNNDGTVGNTLTLSADSGNNNSSYNTGGDSNITTGDANVSANALTFLNNNFAGNVVYSAVNIFGNLVGDIIFPSGQLTCCGGSNTTVANNGNGALSDNNANASLNNNNNTFQTNDGVINNNLVFDAQTGDNSSSFNTGGNSTVSTGKSNVDANVLNIANTNLNGGNMWLVLINQAGNWIGKIMGAADGASYAGSQGTEFSVGPNGEINVSNNGNGSSSNNNANVTTNNNTNTTQNNNGKVQNTLNLTANTGGNDTNFNTGGNSNIQTGNANIVANLVNFVNNNIVGGGKLFVTVVNVFGSWTGDFVGPGEHKATKNSEQKTDNNQGSTQSTNSVQGGNANNQKSSNANPLNNKQSSKTNSIDPNKSGSSTDEKKAGTFVNTFTNNASQLNPISPTATDLLSGVKVAGASTGNGAGQQEKAIEINLAWLLVILPALFVVIIIKKLVMRKMR